MNGTSEGNMTGSFAFLLSLWIKGRPNHTTNMPRSTMVILFSMDVALKR
jgi:hypothetical protein